MIRDRNKVKPRKTQKTITNEQKLKGEKKFKIFKKIFKKAVFL